MCTPYLIRAKCTLEHFKIIYTALLTVCTLQSREYGRFCQSFRDNGNKRLTHKRKCSALCESNENIERIVKYISQQRLRKNILYNVCVCKLCRALYTAFQVRMQQATYVESLNNYKINNVTAKIFPQPCQQSLSSSTDSCDHTHTHRQFNNLIANNIVKEQNSTHSFLKISSRKFSYTLQCVYATQYKNSIKKYIKNNCNLCKVFPACCDSIKHLTFIAFFWK